MPTINFSFKDLQDLVGKKISLDELKELLSYGKAEFENYDKDTDEVTVSCGDTNLPYLWSVEGIARLLKGILGKEAGPIRPDDPFGRQEVNRNQRVSAQIR